MKLPLIGLLAVIAASLLSSCSIIASGTMVSKNFENKDFNAVEVGSAFTCTVTQGKDYSVLVEVDQSVADLVEVTQAGSTLRIGLKPTVIFGINYPGESKVTITMPDLAGLELSGASRGTVSGFTGAISALALGVSGASTLDWTGGQVDALSVSTSGASTMTLKALNATKTTIGVSGASTLTGEASTTTIADLVLDISGASTVSLDVSGSATGSVSGASRFIYGLNPSLAVNLSGASSMNPR